MTSKIDFDLAAATKEDAPVSRQLLAQVIPAFNEFVDAHQRYLTNTNTAEAEKAYIDNPTKDADKVLADQIAKAEKLIEQNRAKLAESAKEAVKPDAEFDEAKSKAAVTDGKNATRDAANTILPTFEMLGYVKAGKVTPSNRKTDWQGVTEDGKLLIKVLQSLPRKVDANSSDDDKDSPAAIAKREVRKNAKEWGRKNGFQVADKGQLSSELLEKYLAQNTADKAKWDNAA